MAERLIRNIDDAEAKAWWDAVRDAARAAPKLRFSDGPDRGAQVKQGESRGDANGGEE
jgi:hypothetical protein